MDNLERRQAFHAASRERRLQAAERLCRDGLKADRERSAWWNFELGCLYQTMAGNGQKARPCYERACAERSQAVPTRRGPNQDEPVASACENLMLISRSYEEYERWASRLEALRPEAEILKQQRPAIRQIEDRDHPWKIALVSIAQAYYKQSPGSSRGTSFGNGFGASAWQTLLLHRKEWRLDHVEWRVSMFGYFGHIALLSEDHARAAARTGTSAWQCAFIPEDTLSLVEEYVRANPHDTEARGYPELLRRIAAELRAGR